MNLAYLISAHTDAPQLKRLIEALQDDAHFFIHIDKKSDISPFTTLLNGDRIHFLDERFDVQWGTLIEVQYQMQLIDAALRYPLHFDRIFFLSGMDYPLWAPGQITRWLEEQGDREILQGLQMDAEEVTPRQNRLYRTARPLHAHLPAKWNRRLSIIGRKARRLMGIHKPLDFQVQGRTWHLYKGSAWWCISEELADFILTVYREKKEVRQYFRDSFGQAETLIQTIAFNSPKWAPRCILTQGTYPGLAALTPLHFIDYDPVIKVLDETDFPRLRESGKMFCRKVVSGKSDHLVRLIREHQSQAGQTSTPCHSQAEGSNSANTK